MTNNQRSVEEIVEEVLKMTVEEQRVYDTLNQEQKRCFHLNIKRGVEEAVKAERQKQEELVEYGRVSVLEDFHSLMKADAFMGLTEDEWKAVQKFFRYNDEISGWKLTQPNNPK